MSKVLDDPRPSSWALGWQVSDTDAGAVIAHGGNGRGFHAFAAASVPQKAAFVVMTNVDTRRSLEHNRLTQLTFTIEHHALTPVDHRLVEIAINQPGPKPVVEKSRSVGNERLDSLDPSRT